MTLTRDFEDSMSPHQRRVFRHRVRVEGQQRHRFKHPTMFRMAWQKRAWLASRNYDVDGVHNPQLA